MNHNTTTQETTLRIPARAFAHEMTYEEAAQVSGGIECHGSDTAACPGNGGKCEPDKGVDCTA